MVYTCVVPQCRSNYPTGPRLSTFKFPSDPDLKKKWIHSIKRKDFEPSKFSRVCELHFHSHEIERVASDFDPKTGKELTVPLKHPRLVKGATPSIIPNAPIYLSTPKSVPRTPPDDRKEKLENEQLREAISASLRSKDSYDKVKNFSSLSEFTSRLARKEMENWTEMKTEDSVIFIYAILKPVPFIKYSVIVNNELLLKVFCEKTELKKVSGFEFPMRVNDFNTFHDVLHHIELFEVLTENNVHDIVNFAIAIIEKIENYFTEDESKRFIFKFLLEQLSNVGLAKHRVRYSPEMLIFFSLVHSISPHAYKFIRNSKNLIMPHPTTIYNLCSKLGTNPVDETVDANFLRYARLKIAHLQERDLHVSLLIDEIHLKSYFDYKGGNIVGAAYNVQVAATSAHVFMLNGLFSSYKDVVHILPVSSFTAQDLYNMIHKIIIGLENIGFKILCIVSDNNSINRKAISFFDPQQKLSIVYSHPCDVQRPIFFVIDPVHILKCVRNNWINQKNNRQGLYYPDFEMSFESVKMYTASFGTLKDLHGLEYNTLLKYGHSLSMKALYPSTLERQNVKLVLQVFNDGIVQALLELGKTHSLLNYEGTAKFLEIICHWWSIINVKTPTKGKRFNDSRKEPLVFTENDENVVFLNKVIDWLNRWEKCSNSSGTLSKETHFALKHSTSALLEMGKYCISQLGKNYFLPGAVQTDKLEERFGKYRQFSGSQYHISIRQIYESESKLRMQDLISLSITSSLQGKVDVGPFDISCSEDFIASMDLSHVIDNILPQVFINNEDICKCQSVLPVITYLAGYCAFSTLKKVQCMFCKDCLILNKQLEVGSSYKLIKDLDRGKLMYPNHDVVNAVTYNYVIIQKLISEPLEKIFLKYREQRELACKLTLILLSECNLDCEFCDSGHSLETHFRTIVWKSTNAILKNYCKKKNDVIRNRPTNKRKLETLQQ